MMDYAAIIIDVVGSRKYNNREHIQEFLKKTVGYCNHLFEKSIKKELMFGAGDEIQGLFTDSVGAYLCIRMFMMLCYPVKIRAGIGRGTIDYENDYWISTELDGNAYHLARAAIEIFGDMSSFGIVYNSGNRRDKILNSLLFSSQILQQRQTGTCQLVKLIAEFIYPFYDPDIMAKLEKESNLLNDVLAEKMSLIPKNDFAFRPTIPKSDILYVNIKENICRNPIIIENQWKKGIATKAASILGTSRQNVEKHIRLGKVIENRNIDAGIVLFLMEEKSG